MSEKLPNVWKKVKLWKIANRITSRGTPSATKSEYYNLNMSWLNRKAIKTEKLR